jgi:hypothetical protein
MNVETLLALAEELHTRYVWEEALFTEAEQHTQLQLAA